MCGWSQFEVGILNCWLQSFNGPKMHLFAPLTCLFYAFLDKSNSPLFAHLIFFIHSKIPTFVTVPWHAMSIFRKTNWYDLPFRFVSSTMFIVAADDLLKKDSCPWTASALPIQLLPLLHIFIFFLANLVVRVMSLYFSQKRLSITGFVAIHHLITMYSS